MKKKAVYLLTRILLAAGLFFCGCGGALAQGSCSILGPLATDLKAKPELEDFFKANPELGVKSYDVLYSNPDLRKDKDALQKIKDYLERTGDDPALVRSAFDNIDADDQLDLLEELNAPVVPGVNAVWNENALRRGNNIENAVGQNLPPNFPVVDKYDQATGTATSIKSINLHSPTYQNTSNLRNKLNKYLRDLEQFPGATYANRQVGTPNFPMNAKVLEIYIPAGASTSQQFILQEIIAVGQNKGIRVSVQVF